jgi:outer membrane protein insertion porin family
VRKERGDNPERLIPSISFAFLLLFVLMPVRLFDGRPSLACARDIHVQEVRIVGLHSMERDELLYLLGIRPGEAIAPESITRGIKLAFLKGIFEQVSVETLGDDESTVWIIVKERDVVEKIEIRGTDKIRKSFVKRNLGIRKHEALREDLLGKNSEFLREQIGKRGYPSASVDINVERSKKPNRVHIVVDIKEGPPLVVEEREIVGGSAQEIAGLMRIWPGKVFDQLTLKQDLKKIEQFYLDKGFIDPIVGPYSYKDGVLHLNVTPGKRLRLKIIGNETLSRKDLREVMPFFDLRDVRDDVVDQAVDLMLDLYHRKGFPDAQVAPIIRTEGADVNVEFYIHEGEKILVDAISIDGTTMEEEKIKSIMALRKRSAFNPDELEVDLERIKEFYASLGYIHASVLGPDIRIAEQWAVITIRVHEGEQVLIANIAFQGVHEVQEEELRAALKIQEGGPYNEIDISESRRRVLALYREYGFNDVEVEVERELMTTEARITFLVSEGRPYYFGKTVVSGNQKTKFHVVDRELRYEEGMILDPSKTAEARQRLYKLGLFSSVEFKELKRDDETVDVSVHVQEARAGSIEFGFGYDEYEKARGFVGVSYKNLWGMNRQASIRTEVSTLSKRVVFNFREPWLFRRELEGRSFLLWEDREEKNIDTDETLYNVEKYSASAGIEKRLSDKVTVNLFYEFSFTDTTDVQPDIVLSKEDVGTLTISSLIPGFIFDTRDNPFDPGKGIFAGMRVKTASELFFSQTDFVKITGRASSYRRLTSWLVAAVSFRGGTAVELGETDELPLVERFFLGGRNTVRGYDQDTLGPKGEDGNPTGGNVFLQTNLELRTRVYKEWRVVPFLDGGNVWLRNRDVDLSEMKFSAGLGLRYNTPVGPLRLDYGFKLDREPGESKGEFHFSIGHAF